MEKCISIRFISIWVIMGPGKGLSLCLFNLQYHAIT